MKLRFRDTVLIIFFSFALLTALVNYLTYKRQGKALEDNYKITSGNIVDFGYSMASASAPPEYSFKVNKKRYTVTLRDCSPCKRFSNRSKYYIQRTKFPVIYDPKNPEVSRMLLRKKDYERYNVPIPDTLKPIIERYFEFD